MDDKQLMENLLLLEKGACDLMLHGTVESASPNVHRAFSTALNASLQMQEQIYDKMQEKGWYPNQQAERQKIEQVMQKFSC